MNDLATKNAPDLALPLPHVLPGEAGLSSPRRCSSFSARPSSVYRDTPDGHEQTLQLMREGDVVNIVGFLEASVYPASGESPMAAGAAATVDENGRGCRRRRAVAG